MNDLTIICYTDNSLAPWLLNRCRLELLKAVEGKRVITVSQEELPFDDNIVVGNIGRSHHSLFTQVLVGAKEVDTKYVALAEHDCMYTPEHFNWVPTDDNIFWYNINHWFVQTKNGEYSYHRRRPMSQLICEREILIRSITEKIKMLETGFEIRKGQSGACEPGVCDNRKAFKEAKDVWWNSMKDVGKEEKWTAKAFRTKLPNLDIRHGGNFSGGRRTKKTTNILPYWGKFLPYLYMD